MAAGPPRAPGAMARLRLEAASGPARARRGVPCRHAIFQTQRAVVVITREARRMATRIDTSARRRTVVGSLLGVGLVLLALGLLTFVSAEMTVMLLPCRLW